MDVEKLERDVDARIGRFFLSLIRNEKVSEIESAMNRLLISQKLLANMYVSGDIDVSTVLALMSKIHDAIEFTTR